MNYPLDIDNGDGICDRVTLPRQSHIFNYKSKYFVFLALKKNRTT